MGNNQQMFKRGVITAFLPILGLSLMSQTVDKWHGTVEFDPVIYTQKGADAGFNLKMTATRHISDYMGIGFGLGVNESFNFGTAPSIPIFARIHAEDYSRHATPFFDMDLGYNLNTDNFDYGGILT